MPQYRVNGVDRDTQFDSTLVVHADDEASARIKAELRGLIATSVVPADASPKATGSDEVRAVAQPPASDLGTLGNKRTSRLALAAASIVLVIAGVWFLFLRSSSANGVVYLTTRGGDVKVIAGITVRAYPRFTERYNFFAKWPSEKELIAARSHVDEKSALEAYQFLDMLGQKSQQLPTTIDLHEAIKMAQRAKELLEAAYVGPKAKEVLEDIACDGLGSAVMGPWGATAFGTSDEVVTDSRGSFSLSSLRPGEYVLFARVDLGNQKVLWAVPVDLSAGEHLKLDLYNGNALRIE